MTTTNNNTGTCEWAVSNVNCILGCLQHAFENVFKTTISAGPMLDAPPAAPLYEALIPYLTNSIWIGKLNRIRHCVQPWPPNLASTSETGAVSQGPYVPFQ